MDLKSLKKDLFSPASQAETEKQNEYPERNEISVCRG